MIPLSAYVAVSAILFMTGLLGVLVRRNFIIVLMSVEVMLNAANINLVAFSHYLESMAGQLVALFIIAIAAGEHYNAEFHEGDTPSLPCGHRHGLSVT